MKERLYKTQVQGGLKEVIPVAVLGGEIKLTPAFSNYLERTAQQGQIPTIMVRNSPGGDIPELMTIKDEFDRIRGVYGVPIRTIAVGWVSSAACDLVAWGSKGYRLAYPSTRFLMHDIQWKSDKSPDRYTSILAKAKEVCDVLRLNRKLEKWMSEATGKPWWELRKYYEQHITAQKALELGLIDEVVVWESKGGVS